MVVLNMEVLNVEKMENGKIIPVVEYPIVM